MDANAQVRLYWAPANVALGSDISIDHRWTMLAEGSPHVVLTEFISLLNQGEFDDAPQTVDAVIFRLAVEPGKSLDAHEITL